MSVVLAICLGASVQQPELTWMPGLPCTHPLTWTTTLPNSACSSPHLTLKTWEILKEVLKKQSQWKRARFHKLSKNSIFKKTLIYKKLKRFNFQYHQKLASIIRKLFPLEAIEFDI